MPQTVVLIHTVPVLLPVFDRLAGDLLPGVRILHVLDEPLLERVRQRGELAAEDSARLAAHVAEAAEIGAHAVLVTCSTVSPCVDDVRPAAAIPVFKIDEAMITAAVGAGTRIGVVATNRTTLEPTRRLLEAEATRSSKAIEIELVLVEGALPALLAGNGEAHDRLVEDAIAALAPRSDVILLAQASMARLLDATPAANRPAFVLSSPHLALIQLKQLLAERT